MQYFTTVYAPRSSLGNISLKKLYIRVRLVWLVLVWKTTLVSRHFQNRNWFEIGIRVIPFAIFDNAFSDCSRFLFARPNLSYFRRGETVKFPFSILYGFGGPRSWSRKSLATLLQNESHSSVSCPIIIKIDRFVTPEKGNRCRTRMEKRYLDRTLSVRHSCVCVFFYFDFKENRH